MNSIDAELVVDTLTLTQGMVRLDNSSYERFFALYYRRLWAYLAVLSDGQEEELEELIQQVFEKVVKRIREFEDEELFWAWLATIAKNCYRDSRRRKVRSSRFRDAIESLTPFLSGREQTDVQIDRMTLEQALSQLTENERYLVYNKYFAGETYRDLARELGISEKAVEQRLSRARTKLRNHLLKEDF